MRLPRAFYERPTLEVARDLIGKVLVHRLRNVVTSGVIVEVEAYIGESDPACHAAPGPTRRNTPLYEAPGFSYVYLNYGIHHLVNVVTERAGFPAAVLIRALGPLDGIAAMRRRRGSRGRHVAEHDLCKGPGNLTIAMGISLRENRVDLLGDRLYVESLESTAPASAAIQPATVVWGPRIGISVGTDRPWRAYVEGHPAVSGIRPGRVIARRARR